MALANYTDLLASLANWTHRDDLTSVFPDFVTIAEAEFSRALRTPQQETATTLSASSQLTALPSDFLEVKSVEYGSKALEFASSDFIAQIRAAYTGGDPRYYSVTQNQLEVLPAPGSSISIVLTYYKVIPPLITNTTNWLLTAYPNLYLYRCLVEAANYLKDDKNASRYAQLTSAAYDAIRKDTNARKWGGVSMRIRAA